MTQPSDKGFSLMELMIALVIISILTVVSATLYSQHVKRARRADAIQTLLAMQLAQENYRASNSSYGTLAQVWNGVSTAQGGYYTLSISNVSGSTYTLTAQATSSQSSDSENGTSCTSLVLAVNGSSETSTPAACWLNH